MNLLQNNPVKSVEFELIRTIVSIFSEHPRMIDMAVARLQFFLNHEDLNCKHYTVKYLGLLGMKELIKLNVPFKDEYRVFVMEAFQSRDPTIRLRALDLLKDVVSA